MTKKKNYKVKIDKIVLIYITKNKKIKWITHYSSSKLIYSIKTVYYIICFFMKKPKHTMKKPQSLQAWPSSWIILDR